MADLPHEISKPLHPMSAASAFGYYVGGSSPLAGLLACVLTKLQSLGHITNELPIHLVDASGKA
eukprot:182306-Hanusia_phi.AAC.1